VEAENCSGDRGRGSGSSLSPVLLQRVVEGPTCLVIPRGTIWGWQLSHRSCCRRYALADAHPTPPRCFNPPPPPTPQINRPPVKLNLLTCQVRPHAEEKKCFDLVTRECPERGAGAGLGALDPEADELRVGTPFSEESGPSAFPQRLAGPPPRHRGTLCTFNPAPGVPLAAFMEEGPTPARRSVKLKIKKGGDGARVIDEWRAVI